MAVRSRILVVEDDPDIRFLVCHLLTKEGYVVKAASNGADGWSALEAEPFDLVVLDLMIPEFSGIEILRRLHEQRSDEHHPRVIVMTAKKEEVDRVPGFELGADDYVTKPFSTRELTLRVRAILRRDDAKNENTEVLSAGPISVHLENHAVSVSGDAIDLTLTEFRLLVDLIQARGRIRTRAALLNDVWGYEADVSSRTVDTHVRRLREKLGASSRWIDTVRGIGYRIRRPPVN